MDRRGAGTPEAESRRRPLGDLLRDLAADGAALIRQEITLAKVELREKVRGLARNGGKMAVGGGVALVGLLVLIAFLVVGLGVLLGGAYWLSSLIVAVLLLGVGGGLAFLGAKSISSSSLAPEASMESVRETTVWAGEEVRELRATLTGHHPPPRTWLPVPRDPAIRVVPASAGAAARRGVPPARPSLDVSAPLYKRVLHEIADDDVTGQGAKVAFFMFSSLPPALLVLFSLTGLIGGATAAAFISARMESALPGSAADPDSAAGFLNTFVEQVVTDAAPGPLSIGLLLGLWASSAVFVALTESLNIAFDVDEDRSWVKRRGLALLTMVGFLSLFLLGSVVLIAGPQIADALDMAGVMNALWSVVQWPLAFLLVVGAFFLVYYVLPNRDQSGCKGVLFKSSAIAAGLWLLATAGFRIYIANFGSYSETYGFVGAILVLLLWMYLTGIVILVGGEISSEMERTAQA